MGCCGAVMLKRVSVDLCLATAKPRSRPVKGRNRTGGRAGRAECDGHRLGGHTKAQSDGKGKRKELGVRFCLL